LDNSGRLRLGEERKLIFENYANGVDIEDLIVAFSRSRLEIEREIAFVGKKIKEYRFRRSVDAAMSAAPPVQCDTLLDIRLNRLALLSTLQKLGPQYLSSELLLPKISVQKLDSRPMVREAIQRVRAAA
jgi:hypothetical protein